MLHQATTITPEKKQKKDLIGSVQRALTIMELLAQSPTGLNAKQISLLTQLNLATCYHLLNTLIASGYIIKDSERLTFHLSSKIGYTSHGKVSPAQLVKQLTPQVQSLQEATHETAYLSLRSICRMSTASARRFLMLDMRSLPPLPYHYRPAVRRETGRAYWPGSSRRRRQPHGHCVF